MILVSACLAGINCKYNGKNNYNEQVVELVRKGKAVPFCPEQLGGAHTPRIPFEIRDGSGEDVLNKKAKVLNKNGEDHSEIFIKGAQESLKIAQMINPEKIILKERSPSCGKNMIYDGSFSGRKVKGEGVTAALLRKHGYGIVSEEEI
jgi:uncharacterized protein YbbK (DUF523 family)